ncbi:hypothetical protein [Maribacter sp.]|uniref:hypothetical protein n=1 Tax=Maribacter sp. TaxID=1897614 RepID=UPI0025BAF449|nr:hypothetical protein [Maribacter sp.]
MKTSTPSTKKVSKTAILVGSAIPGAMFSKGVATLVPGGKLGKLGIAVVAALGAASITGTTTGAEAARGALIGASVQQAGEVILETVQPIVEKYVDSGEPSKLKEFASKAVGLSSPSSFYDPRQLQEAVYQEPEYLGNPDPYPASGQFGV